jgi:hypothetical protein
MQRRLRAEDIPPGRFERIPAAAFAVPPARLGPAVGALVPGFGLAAGFGLATRGGWLRRRLRRQGGNAPGRRIIDGEYRAPERHPSIPVGGADV